MTALFNMQFEVTMTIDDESEIRFSIPQATLLVSMHACRWTEVASGAAGRDLPSISLCFERR